MAELQPGVKKQIKDMRQSLIADQKKYADAKNQHLRPHIYQDKSNLRRVLRQS
jgi:hypothetical protein